MSSQNVVVALGNDLASEGGFVWNVDASIVVQESSLAGDSSFVGERGLNALIPEFLLTGCVFDLCMNFACCWHDKSAEMLQLEDDNVIIILLALVVVVAARQQVCFLVKCAGLVAKNKVVFGQLCYPSCLLPIQLLRLSEILEVLVVHPDFYVFGSTHKIVAPFIEC